MTTYYTVPWLPGVEQIEGNAYHLALQIAVLSVKIGALDYRQLIAVYADALADTFENGSELAYYAFLLALTCGFLETNEYTANPSADFLRMKSLWTN